MSSVELDFCQVFTGYYCTVRSVSPQRVPQLELALTELGITVGAGLGLVNSLFLAQNAEKRGNFMMKVDGPVTSAVNIALQWLRITT